ncbi:MAG: hypothetical protein LLG14_19550 [Nocardiaceae bacterium]|nr:hypothetical protein [Nocardiaceae bacterium]
MTNGEAATVRSSSLNGTATERVDYAQHAARSLELILDAIDGGELDAGAEHRAYLRGALDALTAVTGQH